MNFFQFFLLIDFSISSSTYKIRGTPEDQKFTQSLCPKDKKHSQLTSLLEGLAGQPMQRPDEGQVLVDPALLDALELALLLAPVLARPVAPAAGPRALGAPRRAGHARGLAQQIAELSLLLALLLLLLLVVRVDPGPGRRRRDLLRPDEGEATAVAGVVAVLLAQLAQQELAVLQDARLHVRLCEYCSRLMDEATECCQVGYYICVGYCIIESIQVGGYYIIQPIQWVSTFEMFFSCF